MSIFAGIFGTFWGQRMDQIMRASCITLMRSDYNRLSNVLRLLDNRTFRGELTRDLSDSPILDSIWKNYASWTPAYLQQNTGA